MMKKWRTWVCTAVGGVFGFCILYVAFQEAVGGHGTYSVWGLASLLGLAIGMGNEYRAWAGMFVWPLVQWAFLGLCLGKMVFERKRSWYLGIVGVGMTYLIAVPIGLARLPAYASIEKVYAEVGAGALLGVAMILGAICLRRLAAPGRGPHTDRGSGLT